MRIINRVNILVRPAVIGPEHGPANDYALPVPPRAVTFRGSESKERGVGYDEECCRY
jgi:hypothetical protein